MQADHFRDRAALWRQRAAERTDSRERDADLRLAEEYERLSLSLSRSEASSPAVCLLDHDSRRPGEIRSPDLPALAGDAPDTLSRPSESIRS